MKHFLFHTSFFAVAIFCSASLYAQNRNVQFDSVCQGLTAHAVTSGNFTQVKTSPSINRELKSSGDYIFSNEGIVWNTQRPFSSVLAITNSSIIQTLPDGSSSVIDGSNNQIFVNIAGSLSSLFSGNRTLLESNFYVKFLSTSSSWKMILTPKDSTIASALQSIVLTGKSVSEQSSLDSMLIEEVSGNSVYYAFKNQVYKEELSDAEKAFFIAK
ncbi:MAG: outer membrane lipoprotein carrier protein LolA [Treponema sp.]|nr:outer membrane lipoprotein carrier protein LolA [Treponema sp.]